MVAALAGCGGGETRGVRDRFGRRILGQKPTIEAELLERTDLPVGERRTFIRQDSGLRLGRLSNSATPWTLGSRDAPGPRQNKVEIWGPRATD